ncbi:histidine kinase [Streptomyces somaliensis]|uniref:sensor histidine kinase n=1 Tax=Streptomyces somaliensis TaxID=78355 RepID=UPI0020CE0AC2|nr:histidine kinase [Streptomyces somaliensis]MCP9943923.1 histidine kinase [Streptomyces somaliensis]MCP9975670.1 histidine kinase [Streptomyces somaliensis]
MRYLVAAARSAVGSWFALPFLVFACVFSAAGLRTGFVPVVLERAGRKRARDLDASASVLTRRRIPVPREPAPGPQEEMARLRRELGRSVANALTGLLAGVFVLVPTLTSAVALTLPLWWWLLPPHVVLSPALFEVRDWPTALLSPLATVPHLALLVYLAPPVALLHARFRVRQLTAPGRARLAHRLAEVTTSRAEALEAHAAELRRIERALHDSTQNRLVAVRLHLGIIERLLDGDPAKARELIGVTQSAAEEALAELRNVVRSIYPPVLADRGLAGAVSALTLRCPLPCDLEIGELTRAPAAVEVAAYHVVAETLTNAVKYSGASRIRVTVGTEGQTLYVTVTDDGRGGADETRGSGLAGIRGRVAAFDGTTEVSSPPGGPTTIRVELPCAC